VAPVFENVFLVNSQPTSVIGVMHKPNLPSAYMASRSLSFLRLAFYKLFKKSLIPFRFLRHFRFFESLHNRAVDRFIPRGTILLDCQGVKMYVDSNDTIIARNLISSGRWEAYETELFCQSIKPHMTILDVGANLGYYSLVAAKILNGTGQVIAFEPVPRNYQLFLKSIQRNQFKNIILVREALSNINGTREVFLDTRNYGACSFSEKNVGESSPITVETLTLDSCLSKLGVHRVDLLKVDVEGAEALVLEGAKQTLQQTRLIFMEFWPEAIRNLHQDPAMFLKELSRNFTVRRIDAREKRLIEVSDQGLGELAASNGNLNIFLEVK